MRISLKNRITLYSTMSMLAVLVIGLGVNTYNHSKMQQQIESRINGSFQQNAQLSIEKATSRAANQVEQLVYPVVKNLDILKSNMEVAAQNGKEPHFLLQLFEATMMPQDESVISG